MIGIGVNVAIEAGEFPADLRWPATSVGGGATVDATRDAVSDALGRWVDAPAGRSSPSSAAVTRCLGREIAWEGAGIDPGVGTVAGIDSAATWWSSRRTASPSRWAPARSPCASRADPELSHRHSGAAA